MRWVRPRFDARPIPLAVTMRGRRSVGMIRSVALIVAIDGEGDALMQEALLAGLLAQSELFGRQFGEAAMQLRVMRPHASIGGEHFVVGAPEPVLRVGAFFAGLGIGATPGLQSHDRSCESFLLHVRNENGSSVVPSSGFLTRGSLVAGDEVAKRLIRNGFRRYLSLRRKCLQDSAGNRARDEGGAGR